jgi:hypothetical protein
MEKEEEKIMDKNRAMKRKSYGNEANVLREGLLESKPDLVNKPKPNI